jgi:regulator of sigma E protease
MLQTAAYFFLSLFPLVVAHELGHFIVAKLNRIRVEEFGLGFPPRAKHLFTHDGTDYTLNWLPIGGFVRLAGEDDPTVPGAFASRSKRARAAVLAAGPGANFLFAIVVAAILAVFLGVPRAASTFPAVAIDSVIEGSAAQEAGIKPGDNVLRVNDNFLAVPEVNSADTSGVAATETFQQITKASAGKEMKLDLVRFEDARLVDVPAELNLEAMDLMGLAAQRVTSAEGNSGFAAGDVLVATEGDSALRLRALEMRSVMVIPAAVAEGGEQVGRIGVSMRPATALVQLPAVEAVRWGVTSIWAATRMLVTVLAQMVTGERAAQLSGPAGIAIYAQQSAEAGMAEFLWFLCILSINLGLINLLPIPALDGGRLLFIAVEAIRGRRIEPAREQLVHLIGFALVIGLMVIITLVEVANLNGWDLGGLIER